MPGLSSSRRKQADALAKYRAHAKKVFLAFGVDLEAYENKHPKIDAGVDTYYSIHRHLMSLLPKVRLGIFGRKRILEVGHGSVGYPLLLAALGHSVTAIDVKAPKAELEKVTAVRWLKGPVQQHAGRYHAIILRAMNYPNRQNQVKIFVEELDRLTARRGVHIHELYSDAYYWIPAILEAYNK